MMAMMFFAAAANAPVMLAANDEAQWRRFARASLQPPAVRAPSRLMQLQGVVRRLGDDRGTRSQPAAAGPYGL